jgi:SET domain-containing protein
MTKTELLTELQQDFYVALQPSAIHGIGVFAVRDIPKGCRQMFAPENGEWITLSFEEVAALPAHSREFIETYFLYDETQYFIPAHGCKKMDIASYLNHSGTPNIISVNEGAFFEALRDIKKGEELLVDYGTIVEGAEGY